MDLSNTKLSFNVCTSRYILYDELESECNIKYAKKCRVVLIVLHNCLLCIGLLVLIVWFGVQHEQWYVRNSPETIHLYNERPDVCAFEYPTFALGSRSRHDQSTKKTVQRSNTKIKNETEMHSQTTKPTSARHPLHFETFISVQEAKNSNLHNSNSTTKGMKITRSGDASADADVVIAHCGECGSCSNPHDIHIYDETKDSLFGSTLKCAKQGMVFGRETASSCMKNAVGLTDDCNDCWVDNIMCDLKKCIFTCTWYGFLFKKVGGPNKLNPCTLCDEKRCGPEFVTCAGANRRRSGILSNIERNQEKEVCSKHDPLWWVDPPLLEYFEKTVNPVNRRRRHDVTGLLVDKQTAPRFRLH